MDILAAIKARKSVRDWEDRPVPDSAIRGILEAGQYAPSPQDSQPWSFIVVGDKSAIEGFHAVHGSFLGKAPLVIVVTVDQTLATDAWLHEHGQYVYGGACALENMWLATEALGLGACWVTLDDATTRTQLGVPESHAIIGSLAVGYPTERAERYQGAYRKPLETMTYAGRFGEKWTGAAESDDQSE